MVEAKIAENNAAKFIAEEIAGRTIQTQGGTNG
jgi:hypothetical protein